MATKHGKMVIYREGLPPMKSHNSLNMRLRVIMTNQNSWISSITMPMATKPNKAVTYHEELHQ